MLCWDRRNIPTETIIIQIMDVFVDSNSQIRVTRMDALDWVVSPSLAGCSPAKIWASIPRFSVPTSGSAESISVLGYAAPFVLIPYNSKTMSNLFLYADGAEYVQLPHITVISIKVSNGRCMAKYSGTNVENALSIFQTNVNLVQGIYPLP